MWPDAKFLVPDKGSMFNFAGTEEDPTWWTTRLSLVNIGNAFPASIPGHYIVTDNVEHVQAPFRVELKDLDDAIILSFKVVSSNVYLQGITVPKLLEWRPPPKATDEVCEAGLLTLWKLPCAGVVARHPLTNTDSHKLKDLTDKLISHIPSFKLAKLRSIKDVLAMDHLEARRIFCRALDAGEMRERKAASSKGKTCGDTGESVAGGRDAGTKIAALKTKWLPGTKYYEVDIEDRFISVTLSGSKLIAEAIDEAKSKVAECVHCIGCAALVPDSACACVERISC